MSALSAPFKTQFVSPARLKDTEKSVVRKATCEAVSMTSVQW